MQTKAVILVPLLASVAAFAAIAPDAGLRPAAMTTPPLPSAFPPAPAPAPMPGSYTPVSSFTSQALAQWSSLRQSDNYPFSSYASFLMRYRGWPGESSLRRTAERAIDPLTSSPSLVVGYFRMLPPLTPMGQARYASALLATGQLDAARATARLAWVGGAMPRTDEDRLLAQFGAALTIADHDQRVEKLLAAGETSTAYRLLPFAAAAKRPVYEARIALQTEAPDAAAKLALVGTSAVGDPGLLMDRARWLRNTSQSLAARALLAQPRTLTARPADPEKWYEVLLLVARAAAADRQWTTAYQIASQVDDAYPPGTDISLQSTGERDDYTSLVWLAGTTALHQLGRPADAIQLFVRYARGGRSAQVTTKGLYWAGRAAQAVGQTAQANAYFAEAAAFPELFYGQLSLERIGRPVPPPLAPIPPTEAERQAFQRKDLVDAAKMLGLMGRWEDQSLFVRALSERAQSERERVLTAELSRQIGRPDLAVWLARDARNAGTPFYVRPAYPEVSVPLSSHYWSLAHGIIRQESSFDRAAVSHAGARGMMQLMPPTARQWAGKLGLPYELGRLTRDSSYNIMLGSQYFASLMDDWGGYAPLAVASYNAGPGNVRKWISANGDPRMPGVDIVKWIEDIPYTETRGYVQRVLENAVVYDAINPARANAAGTIRLSFYLGKSSRPG
ncbi:MAG: lytic transglycosylase protein [Alphaproteobacteria bacterium]|nr:lytic transglycosylase protein [Alphaproteobacteria bacterium]